MLPVNPSLGVNTVQELIARLKANQLTLDNIASALPMARSGKLKALAVTSLKRSPGARVD